MDISIGQQAGAFAGAVLLGFGVGIIYDILRLLRSRLRLRVTAQLLDLLFWILVTVALFLYVIGIAGGEVRIYILVALFGGAVVYFWSFSDWIQSLGNLLADAIAFLVRLMVLPFHLAHKMAKKIQKNFKNLFLYHRKWSKIEATFKGMEEVARYGAAQKKEGGYHADCKSWFADQSPDSGASNRSGNLSAGAQQPVGSGSRTKRRADPSGGSADTD